MQVKSLPDGDGIEVTREIKKSNPDIKVIILTLCDAPKEPLRERPETILSAFAAGGDAYCLKNIGFERLTEVIYLTFEGQTWIDPAIAYADLSVRKAMKFACILSWLNSWEGDICRMVLPWIFAMLKGFSA